MPDNDKRPSLFSLCVNDAGKNFFVRLLRDLCKGLRLQQLIRQARMRFSLSFKGVVSQRKPKFYLLCLNVRHPVFEKNIF
jgi:hypothetical protein